CPWSAGDIWKGLAGEGPFIEPAGTFLRLIRRWFDEMYPRGGSAAACLAIWRIRSLRLKQFGLAEEIRMARGVISRRGNRLNNSMKKAGLLATAVAGVFATGLLSARPAEGALFAWDTSHSGNWSGNNWILSSPPTGANNTDQLVFAGTGSVAYTSTVDAFVNPWIINGIFLGSDSTAAQTINNTNTLGFQLSGSNPFIEQQRSGAFNISSPIALGGATTLQGTGTGLTTLSGVISGSNTLNVTGGNWRLSNAGNSWSGG